MSKREPITPDQLKKIWTVVRTTGMPESRLRFIVKRISGQESTRVLTKVQAKKIIKILEGTGSLPVSKNNDKVFALITSGQLSLIENLRVEAEWSNEHLMSFILKNYKRDDLRKLNRQQAGIVIKVLKSEKLKNQEVV